MTDYSDLVTATRAVLDPSTTGVDLAQIAQWHQRLWPLIAAHPNAYPGLLQWLDANGDVATKQAVTNRLVSASPVAQIVTTQQTTVPSFSSYASARSNRRSKRSWVIGIAGVVVIALAVLLIVVFRPSSPKLNGTTLGPTLSLAQFVWLLQESTVAWPELSEESSDAIGATAGAKPLQLDGDSAVQACMDGLGFEAVQEGFQGFLGRGLDNMVQTQSLTNGAWLFDSTQHAASYMNMIEACEHLGENLRSTSFKTVPASSTDNVAMMWSTNRQGDMQGGIAQYGNVIVSTTGSSFQVPWVLTWDQFRQQAPTLRHAIESASRT